MRNAYMRRAHDLRPRTHSRSSPTPMSDNGRYTGEDAHVGDSVPEVGAPLTRRQLREREAELALFAQPVSSEVVQPVSSEAEGSPAPSPVARSERRAAAAPQPSPRNDSARSGFRLAVPRPKVRLALPRPTLHNPVSRPTRKMIASKLFSGGALVFAAALLVGTTVPANAFMSVDDSAQVAQVAPGPVSGQSLYVSANAVENVAARDSFTVTSYAELLRQKYGNISYNYSVTSGAVRWPFPYAVPISSGYGERIAPCRGCSSQHLGLDFTPGAGTPIYAIASGVVGSTEISRWGYGNSVVLEHVVNGQKVESLYAHMQMNSSPLLVGDLIAVGDFVGLVGSTGASTGTHLHLEIHIDGVPVNPFAWLKSNAVN
jgi:murein DD-endopeptidase MepM/ murein hydrolase activator NlpD